MSCCHLIIPPLLPLLNDKHAVGCALLEYVHFSTSAIKAAFESVTSLDLRLGIIFRLVLASDSCAKDSLANVV